ncbi:MAG: type II toxin-antitoxin system VapC family toxin [Planctomycetes bacterium]|nr:type II toxin-antitoxin system VapC family toxin [Planctomycetota bacterium]
MGLYALDTDTISLFRQGHEAVCHRIASCPPSEIATTVITVEEYLTGWYALVRKVRRAEQLELAYRELAEAPGFLAQFQVLSFTQAAMARFDALVALKLNVGRMDLRIAAIVLEVGATLVTRNLRDFRRVPALLIEDWTQP